MNRYIKSITLVNFQSYKNTKIDFSPGLVLLEGTSDSGKSAILRAMSFVLYNYPRKDTLIHWGATETRVTLEFSDGVKVTRIKGTGRNAIEAIDADGNVIVKEKIDKEIPDDIKQLLGNPPQDDFNGLISYSDQFSPMFLVDLSPTDLPRSLSNLTGVEVLEESAKQLMQNYKALEKQNKQDEKEYTSLVNEAQGYSFIEEFENKISLLEEKNKTIEGLENKANRLKEITKGIDLSSNLDCSENLNNTVNLIDSKLQKIKKIQSLINKYNNLKVFKLFSNSSCSEDDITNLDNIIERIDNCDVTLAQEMLSKATKLKQVIKDFLAIKKNGENLVNEFKTLQSNLEKQENEVKEFKNFLIEEKIQCEACGSILK